MRHFKYLLLIAILVASGVLCYAFPKNQYKSQDILKQLDIPESIPYWQSRDVVEELNLKDARYNFVNRIFARQYMNDLGEDFLFLIFDAGNFHHPKICFTNAGFKVEPQKDIEIETPANKFRAKALFMDKGRDSVLVVYWICINKKTVDWTQQKIDEFIYSLFNKEKVGLMGRLEISTSKESLPHAVDMAKDFLKNFSRRMNAEDAAYLFGEKS